MLLLDIMSVDLQTLKLVYFISLCYLSV